MRRFENKVVLLTGAGSGIGQATALRLDQEGATLIIADINSQNLEQTRKMLTNGNSSSMVLDISSIEDSKRCFLSALALACLCPAGLTPCSC